MLEIGAAYSTLSPSQLFTKVLPQYPIENATSCEFLQRGINDTYHIKTLDQSYLLRVYRQGWRTLSHINFELDSLNYLKAQDAQIAYPIKRRDGSYITGLNTPEGIRYAVVTTFAQGDFLRYEDPQDAYLYGESVAQIHTLSADFHSPHSRFKLDENYLFHEPLAAIKPFFDHRLADFKFIENLGIKLLAIVHGTPQETVDYGFCHGDCHGGNAYKFSQSLTFFDFDCCGLGWRAYDLATFRWGARLQGKEDEWWHPFLQGYRSQRQLTEADLQLTTAFMALRDLWLMGLYLANTTYFGRGWFNDAYIDQRMQFLRGAEELITPSP